MPLLSARARRIVARTIIGLALALVLATALLHTPPVKRYAIQQAVVILRRQGVEFDASHLNYNLLDLSMDLGSVQVRSPQAPDLPPLLMAERVRVDLSLWKVIRGVYHIEDGEVSNPRLHFVIDKNGRDNVPRPPARDDSGSPLEYFIDRFRIQGGALRVEDRRQDSFLELPLKQATINGEAWSGNHNLVLESSENGFVSLQGRRLALSKLSADAVVEKDAVIARRIDVAIGASTLSLAGKVGKFAAPEVDLRASGKLDLASLSEFAGAQYSRYQASGSVAFDASAKGPVNGIYATAKVDAGEVNIDPFRKVAVQAEMAYDARSARLRLDSLNLSSSLGAVRVTADVALNAAAGQSTANLAVEGLQAAQLAAALQFSARPASRISARIAANWPDTSFERANGNATIRLEATQRTASRNTLPLSGTITVATKSSRMVLNAKNLSGLGAIVNGEAVVLDRRRMSGTLTAQVDDAAVLASNVERFLGEAPGSLVGTNLSGGAKLSAQLSGTVQKPVAAMTLDAPQMTVGSLAGVTVQGDALYDSTSLKLNRATVSYREQTLSASGNLGLQGRSPAISFAVESNTLSIPVILSSLNVAHLPVEGTATVRANLSGTTKRPVADFQADAQGLLAYGENLGTAALRGSFADKVARLEEFELVKPQVGGNGELNASGTYRLDTKAYEARVEASGIQLNGLTLQDGSAVRAKDISLQASGQGRLDEPSGSASLRVAGLTVRDIEAGDVSASGSVLGQKGLVEVSAPKYGISGKADVATLAPYAGSFELQARDTNLETLPFVLPQPVQGKVTMVVRGSGNLAKPEEGMATAEIAAADLEWRGQPIRSEGPLRARYEGSRLFIEQATITARESKVSLRGSLPLTESAGAGSIQLAATLDLATLPLYLPTEATMAATGTFRIEGEVKGTLKRIEPELTLSLDAPSISAQQFRSPVKNVKVAGSIRNGALEIANAEATMGPASVVAKGTIPFGLLPPLPVELPRRQGPAAFSAELKSLNLGSVAALPEGAYGTLSARLEATAARADLESLQADLTLPEFKIGIGSFGLEQKAPVRLRVENAVARVEEFELVGPLTDLRVTGTAGLLGEMPLNLRMDGTFDAAIANAFTEAARVEGKTELHASIGGTAKRPTAEGNVTLRDAQIALQNPRVAIEGLDLDVALAGNQATITKLNGNLNGGALSGGGTLTAAGGGIANANLSAKAEGVFLDFPEGLKTVSDLELTLSGGGGDLVLGGQVNILEGGFTDDLSLDRGILAALSAPRGVDLTEDRNATLERLRFNVGVNTVNPLVVDNNLAKAEVRADLRVLGNPYEPGISGRLTIEENGEIRLQERRYLVERGVINFNNERRIEPELDVIATTAAAGYDIRLQVLGEPGKTETTLTSDPSLPEPDILAILITGKTLDQMRGQEFHVARDQVLSYLGGRVGSTIGRGIAGATGLSTVRLEPNLIAAEADPSARLTVGQDITRNLELIYSMDLINSADQIYVAEYDLTRRFTTRGTRQSDGSLRMDFRHDLRFGGIPEPQRDSKRHERRIGSLEFLGSPVLPEEILRKKLKVKEGDRYDFFRVRKGVDRISKLYREEGLLESRVRLQRGGQGGVVDLDLTILRGPKVGFVFEGIGVPSKVARRVKEVWAAGVFDSQRLEDARETLREWLVEDNYLQPQIEYRVTSDAAAKRVLFDIQPGPKFRDVKIEFEGISFQPAELRDVVKSQKLETEVYTKPGRVSELLRRFYQEQGYLDATVAPPRYELDAQAGTGRVVIAVNEGPLFRVGSIAFSGNTVFDQARLAEEVVLAPGDEYKPVLRDNAMARLKDLYWQSGYNDVEATFVASRGNEAGRLDVRFAVTENDRSVVREILVEGNDKTSEALIRTQIELAVGEPLNLQKLGNSRRNLYRTGAFSAIDVANERIDNAVAVAGERPTRLRVKVREIQPFELKYGGFFDTERGPGVIADLSNRNSLGSARVLGLRTRYDSQLREARVYFSQPLLRRFPVRTIASSFVRQERNPATSDTDPFNVDRIGMSVQQEASFRKNYLLNYGYRLEKSRTFDPGPDPLFDIPLRIGSLTATLSRETRDEILDATRGQFFSHALQYSAAPLGSELSFLKYFGQYFRYVPLQKPRVELFTNKVERPRLVYAGGVRIGLAKGFGGQDVPLSERFFAGGATTLRGFEQNTVGPVAGRQPLGGEAMLVINSELRAPLFGIFDGVGFVDVGNVYDRVGDFRLSDLRKTAGVGLRVRTPWFLVRMDYGVKLDRRPGETAGRLFFSIGQAF